MYSGADKCVKEGFVWIPPQGVLSQLKKSWQRKYCKLYKASKYGIERLEVFDSEEDAMKTSLMPIITLENCIKITEDSQKHNQAYVFLVVTKTNIQHFAANTKEDMKQWVTALQSVAFKDSASRQTIEEDNELYCSSEDASFFTVQLVETEASKRCSLIPGQYTLVVTQAELQLRDELKLRYTWPYRFIRRYGYKQGSFTFEAGRKCESGEGKFHMEHSNQQEIFRCISSKMKSMKKLLTSESLSSPAIICGDDQFHAALNMMARSRSPLPPSSIGSNNLFDSEFSPLSTVKPSHMSVPDIDSKPPLPLKPKPTKPPRKGISNNRVTIGNEASTEPMNNNSFSNSADYDDVEIRNEAWKTMGINIMPHSERPFSITVEGAYKSASQQPEAEEHHYDKLEHLGPTSKHPCPGYRQLVSPFPITQLSTETNMEFIRTADDSYLGYGVIRKKAISLENNATDNTGPLHNVYNDFEYAIVCKPNRV